MLNWVTWQKSKDLKGRTHGDMSGSLGSERMQVLLCAMSQHLSQTKPAGGYRRVV